MSEILSMAMSIHGQYLFPFVLILMALLVSSSVIEVVYSVVGAKRSRR